MKGPLLSQVRVVGAAILERGRCLVAQRGPTMSLHGKWEFPGGKVEPSETPAEALARELQEELGLVIAVGALLGETELIDGHRRLTLAVYAARRVAGEPIPTEHAAWRWVTAAELATLDWAEADIAILPAVRAALEGELAAPARAP